MKRLLLLILMLGLLILACNASECYRLSVHCNECIIFNQNVRGHWHDDEDNLWYRACGFGDKHMVQGYSRENCTIDTGPMR